MFKNILSLREKKTMRITSDMDAEKMVKETKISHGEFRVKL
jgi:hypothetical protein